MVLVPLVSWLILAACAAIVGSKRGRGADGFLLGLGFGPWGLVMAMLLQPSRAIAEFEMRVRMEMEEHLRGESREQRLENIRDAHRDGGSDESSRNLAILILVVLGIVGAAAWVLA